MGFKGPQGGLARGQLWLGIPDSTEQLPTGLEGGSVIEHCNPCRKGNAGVAVLV